ncbi:MAG: hypothetical protein AB1896_10435 [Thermodesulfobacteriota bacterium]
MKKFIILLSVLALLLTLAPAARPAEVLGAKKYECQGVDGEPFVCEITRYRDEAYSGPGSTRAQVVHRYPSGDSYTFWVYPCGQDCGYVMVDQDFAYVGGAIYDFENDRAVCGCK